MVKPIIHHTALSYFGPMIVLYTYGDVQDTFHYIMDF